MKSEFNPLTDVPKTDEEAKIALRCGYDSIIATSLVGIFEVRRLQGEELLEAYENTLLTHIRTAEQKL